MCSGKLQNTVAKEVLSAGHLRFQGAVKAASPDELLSATERQRQQRKLVVLLRSRFGGAMIATVEQQLITVLLATNSLSEANSMCHDGSLHLANGSWSHKDGVLHDTPRSSCSRGRVRSTFSVICHRPAASLAMPICCSPCSCSTAVAPRGSAASRPSSVPSDSPIVASCLFEWSAASEGTREAPSGPVVRDGARASAAAPLAAAVTSAALGGRWRLSAGVGAVGGSDGRPGARSTHPVRGGGGL